MPIGPQLPPSAEKRKRDSDDDGTSSDDAFGPSIRAGTDKGDEVKKPRVVGPLMPPAPLEELPEEPVDKDEESSSDDDDFGPSLPGANDTKSTATTVSQPATAPPVESKRDEWMTIAPTNGDWSSRIDPTKIKSRKFNTGKSAAKASSGTDMWHETPEQKQARLQRELLGMKEESKNGKSKVVESMSQKDRETAERIAEYNKQRGPSLYNAHQEGKKEEEDDPSKRAFDREKDIGGGLKINSTQRRDLMKKASDFNSRFSTAKYL